MSIMRKRIYSIGRLEQELAVIASRRDELRRELSALGSVAAKLRRAIRSYQRITGIVQLSQELQEATVDNKAVVVSGHSRM